MDERESKLILKKLLKIFQINKHKILMENWGYY